MFKSLQIQFTVLLVIIVLSSVPAFDGNRKGVYMGLGVGTGFSLRSYRYKVIEYVKDREVKTNLTFFVNYKIGYGFSEKLILFFQCNNLLIKPFTNNFSSSIIGLGVNIFQKESYPTLFYEISLGYSPWYYLFNKDANDFFAAHGIGLEGGIGVHINKIFGAGFNVYMAYTSKDKSVPYYKWDPNTQTMVYDGQLEYTDIYKILCFQLEFKVNLF